MMSIRHRSSFMLPFFSMLLLLTLLLAACGQVVSGTAKSSTPTTLKKVTIGLGYLPDIQFAPFYVAQTQCYYRNAGLDVTFHHGIVNNLIGSMAFGRDQFLFASGDEELVAPRKARKDIDVATI